MKTIIENKLNDYRNQLEMNQGTLVSNNLIIECGPFTVCKNEEGFADLSNKTYPSQWTDKGAKEIMTKCNFKDKNGNSIELRAVNYKEWYRNQIAELEQILDLLAKS